MITIIIALALTHEPPYGSFEPFIKAYSPTPKPAPLQQDPWAPWAQWATKVEQRVSTLEKFSTDAVKMATEAQSDADLEHERLSKRIDALETKIVRNHQTVRDGIIEPRDPAPASDTAWWIDMVKDGTLVTLLTGVAAGLYRMSGRLQRTEAAVGASTDKSTEIPPSK